MTVGLRVALESFRWLRAIKAEWRDPYGDQRWNSAWLSTFRGYPRRDRDKRRFKG